MGSAEEISQKSGGYTAEAIRMVADNGVDIMGNPTWRVTVRLELQTTLYSGPLLPMPAKRTNSTISRLFFSSSFRLFQLHQRDLNLHPRTSSGQASRVDDFVWTAGVVSEDSLLITSSGRGDSDPNAFNTEGTNDVINPHWLQTLFQTLVHATSRVP